LGDQSKMKLALLTALAGLSTALATPFTTIPRQTNSSSSLSAGCGKTTTLKSGKQPSIKVNNQNRDWILRIPAGYDASKPHKLIFGLHWLNGDYNAVDQGNFYSLAPLANNTAIFVAPNGLNSGWANTNGQDITFIGDLMQQVEDSLCVDLNQVYSVGWSYGGAMSRKSYLYLLLAVRLFLRSRMYCD
jgi:poly(3-hydroxybutyrate) depolymerase